MKTLIQSEVENSLESMLREGARRMLQTALEMEVASYLEVAREDRDEAGGQAVVRNGHHRVCQIVCVTDYCVGILPSNRMAN